MIFFLSPPKNEKGECKKNMKCFCSDIYVKRIKLNSPVGLGDLFLDVFLIVLEFCDAHDLYRLKHTTKVLDSMITWEHLLEAYKEYVFMNNISLMSKKFIVKEKCFINYDVWKYISSHFNLDFSNFKYVVKNMNEVIIYTHPWWRKEGPLIRKSYLRVIRYKNKPTYFGLDIQK